MLAATVLVIVAVAFASRLPVATNGVGAAPQQTSSSLASAAVGAPSQIAIGPGATVDGFTLGALATCSNPVGSIDPKYSSSSCAGMLKEATIALDARNPGHAAVVSVEQYSDGTRPGPIDVTGSGPVPTLAPSHLGPDVTVFVFTLADGSVRATGVACADTTSCAGVAAYPD
ncbi:MAG: hypothetical protein LH624_09905 [Cryobacterium sp.]|nr:hypothetical protein [Cryobacterium sp.]